MNQTMKELYLRKSVRVFENQEISEDNKQQIIEAAMQAPTAGNMQMYSILDITDQDLLDKLAISCDDQPFISKAKMALIFCADYQKWNDVYKLIDRDSRKPNVGELMLAVNDTLIAAQNSVVAAHSLGVGSCYIGDIMEKFEYHKELLNLPQYVFPVTMLVFGYPTQQQQTRKKPKRFSQKYIVHNNQYNILNKEELIQMFDERDREPMPLYEFEKWLHAFYNRKYNTDFSVEMSRSVQKYIEEFTK